MLVSRDFSIPMAEDNKKEKKGGEFRVPPRTWILWIAILGAIPLLLLFRDPRDHKEPLTQNQFLELFRANAIKEGTIWYNIQDPLLQDITGTYTKPGSAAPVKFATTVHLDDSLDRQLRRSKLFEPKRPNTLVQNMIVSIVPI